MFGIANEIVKKQFLNQIYAGGTFTGLLGVAENVLGVRFASKKTGGSTRNRKSHARPKHRKIYLNDGCLAHKGNILVKQNTLRFHPGLNVGFGKNGTLFALEEGRVVVTCEKIDPNLDHTWITRIYAGRDLDRIHKKYFNVIPEKEHVRFKPIDSKTTIKYLL